MSTKRMLKATAVAIAATLELYTVRADTWTDDKGIAWNYTIEDGTASIEGDIWGDTSAVPKSTTGDLVIPSELGGCPVVKIGVCAFQNCTNLTGVAISEGVEEISWGAFDGCKRLLTIKIPASVKEISDAAFSDCSLLSVIEVDVKNLYYQSVDGVLYDKSLETLICCPGGKKGRFDILDSVYRIEDYACEGCIELTSVNIPEGVEEIGDGAFQGCVNLISIEIPDGVYWISDSMFEECTSLKSVSLPEGVTDIGDGAFWGCAKLESIIIPSSVEEIGYGAFENCCELTNIEIPEKVIEIGDRAFDGCLKLASIDVDDNNMNYRSIDGVLYDKRAVTLLRYPEGRTGSFAIPDTVETIEEGAFNDCTSLTAVTISKGVKTISEDFGGGLFANCTKLENVNVAIANLSYQSIDGVLYNKSGTKLICCPNGKSGALTVPDTVMIIEDYAFANCSGLTDIFLTNGVTSIGSWAFYRCNITSFVVPRSVTEIGMYTFLWCRSLRSLIFKGNAPSDWWLFAISGIDDDCVVYVPSGSTGWDVQIPGELFNGSRIEYGEPDTGPDEDFPEFTIENGVLTKVELNGATVVSIPTTVTRVADNVFSNNEGLVSVIVPSTVSSIGSGAFCNCRNLHNVEFEKPSDLKTVGKDAFKHCEKMNYIALPASLTSIDGNVFSYCSSLQGIVVDGEGGVYKDVSGVLYSSDKARLVVVPGATTNLTVLQSVRQIEKDAFSQCIALRDVSLPKSLEGRIPEGLFRDCPADLNVSYYEMDKLQPLQDRLSGDMTLFGGCVYIASNDVTVARGAILTIQPGAIVKFARGVTLRIEGTLNAQGSIAEPVVFTSLRDDANGGDTNGDGGTTTAQPGDWNQIWVGGTAKFNYSQILYNSATENYGGLEADGTVTFENSMIAHAKYECVNAHDGSFTARNSVFWDSSLGFGYYGEENVRAYNCVFAGLTSGIRESDKILVNCIFYECIAFTDQGGNGSKFRNCVFFNPAGYGAQRYTKCGKNGNVWADPLFVDPDNGDFRIAANSPCVDAGDGTYAPEKDRYGSPRMDVPLVRDSGVASANGAVPDIGIHEVPGDSDVPSADLTVTSVSVPETLKVGESAEIGWTVKNVGEDSASGAWRDEIELVAANGQTFTMGTITTQFDVRPGTSASFKATVAVPAAPEGTVRVRVTANKYQDLFEAMKSDNNVGDVSTTLAVPTLSVPTDGTVTTLTLGGDSDYGFTLDGAGAVATQGGVLVIRCAGEMDAWLGNGAIAAKDNAIRTAVKIADGTWLLQIPAGSEPRVTVRNDGEGEVAAQLSLEVGGFFLLDTGKKSAANSGMVPVPFFGNGFSDSLACWLEREGQRVEASDLKVESGVSALATFDVTGCEAGDWTLHVKKGADEASASLLTLTESRVGAKWWCKVNVASTVRAGRVYVGSIEYGNKGDMAMPAPYLHVVANEGTLIRLNEADAWSDSTELLAISETYPASSLKAGESCKVEFFYKTSGSRILVDCDYTLSDTEPFPWDTNSQYMRPSWATDEMWRLALATLKSNVGATWNDFLQRMRDNADYLMKIGRTKARLDRMWQMEINDALGVDFAVQTLAGGVDLVRNGHGFAISFSRTYGSSMASRLRMGALGYGWRDNCSTYLERVDPNTLVMHASSGMSYQFTKTSGSWVSEEARDRVRVDETTDAYVFAYGNGIVQTVPKSIMRASSIRDNKGNEITFTYNGQQLHTVRHTDGGVLTFKYSGDKILSISDDRGRTVRYGYTGDMLTSVTAFNGLVTRYVYHAADSTPLSRALTQIVYPDNTTKDYTYDDYGRVATVSVNGNQFTTEIVRGLCGSYSIIAPNGGVTEVTVGAKGNVPKIVNALGQMVKQKYTDNGLLESVIAPSGKRNKMNYNTDGLLVSAFSASGAETSFAYEPEFDNLVSVTDAKGHAIRYGYDGKGRGNSLSYVDGSMSSLEYNEKGDVAKATNRRGETIEYEYDAEGSLTKKTWPNGRTFTLAYDARGNVTNASDSVTGAVTMEYDAKERLTRIVYPKGRGFTYAYDEFGRMTERTMLHNDGVPAAAQDKQRYTYDSLGRLATVTDGDGNPYLANAYDPTTGWLVTQTYGNGTVVSNAYDILGRTIGIYHGRASSPSEPPLAFFEYAYDSDGKCISQTTAEGTESYTYDADGQLTAVTYPDDTSETFTYDAVGNRITSGGARSVATVTYTVNALNQYTNIDDTTLEYDLDGNMTRKGDTRYTYDTLNRLVAVTNEAENIRWSCEYDVFGNRVSVTDNGTTTERLFVQGSLPSVAAEFHGDTLSKSHILVGAVRLADISRTGGSPVQTRYYHADMLGSARLLTDGTGTTKGTRSFKAFGETRVSTGETTDAGYVGTLGVETDSNGLLFMRNRYYDAGMGRFLQMDPIGLKAGDVNEYRYCGNDAISHVDVLGLQSNRCSPFCPPKCSIIGRVPPPNGCGAAGHEVQTFILNGISLSANEWLCVLHDIAYSVEGIPKEVADTLLGDFFEYAVSVAGQDAYDTAQANARERGTHIECSSVATDNDMLDAVNRYAHENFRHLEPKGFRRNLDAGPAFSNKPRGGAVGLYLNVAL